ncbi:MAG TPA: DUF6797 domain-containing protein [Planctomycetota bacterium]|nr:DUF6797 domain-containing protein [Planctomycetota bacterium]
MKHLLAVLCLFAIQDPDLAAGLVGEYFEMPGTLGDFPAIPAGRKPTFVRVDKSIDFDEVSGDFYGTRLTQNFYARWNGVLRVEKAGAHVLYSDSDDGSRITIDGKVIVNNGGTHPMQEKSGTVELAAGDHEIRIEFFQAGGGAGIKVSWQPAGGKRQGLSKALFHPKAAETLEWDRAAWEKRPKPPSQSAGQKGTGKYALMDRGVLSSGTIDCLWGGRGNFANKGIAVLLDRSKQASICFDTELLKFTSGWTGGFIGWPSGRDGIEGQPAADGTVRFGSRKNALGISKGGEWKDPRPIPYGPLPRDWGRYRGLYLHGDRVIFSYTAGDAQILDMPGYDPTTDTFTRAINATRPCRLLISDRDEATVVTASGEATVEAQGNRIELAVRAGWSSVAIGAGMPPAPADLAPLTRGAPGRNEAVTVAGSIGKEAGAFQVDTIPVPYDNPSKSYMRLTGVDFFSDGKRAAVCTLDGDVWIVSGIDESLEKITWKRFASGLFQTLGLRIVGDQVYTLGRDQITRFHDFNGDGEADFYECFNNDCGVTPSYHEFTHDLHTDSQGNWYYAKGSNLGGAVVPFHGCLVRVSKDGLSSEVWATGFRAPNGFAVGPDDVIATSDNQGNWTPSTPINYLTEKGQFCGFVPCSHQKPEPKVRPLALHWIPYDLDNSGGGQIWCTSDKWGPFKNQLFHLSYGKCALFYILREKSGPLWQGGSIKFPFKFLSGSMRGRFNPVDGQMYLVGMRGWQTDANRDGCFQRVRYTGKPANLPLEAKVTSGGLSITFTDPLDRESAASVDSYSATWANLRWTAAYGSDEYWVSDPNKKGREPLPIKSASLSADGKTVTLEIDGLKPVYYVRLNYRLRSADGAPIRQELDYTINRVP